MQRTKTNTNGKKILTEYPEAVQWHDWKQADSRSQRAAAEAEKRSNETDGRRESAPSRFGQGQEVEDAD